MCSRENIKILLSGKMWDGKIKIIKNIMKIIKLTPSGDWKWRVDSLKSAKYKDNDNIYIMYIVIDNLFKS